MWYRRVAGGGGEGEDVGFCFLMRNLGKRGEGRGVRCLCGFGEVGGGRE